MALYKARARLLVGTQTIEPGEEFTSSAVPGAAWHPLDAAAIAASRARFGSTPPTEFALHYWDTSKGMRARAEDPRVSGSFSDADGGKVVRN